MIIALCVTNMLVATARPGFANESGTWFPAPLQTDTQGAKSILLYRVFSTHKNISAD